MTTNFQRVLAAALASGTAIALCEAACAQSFFVDNGETAGAQFMNDAGDFGGIASGGAIEVFGAITDGVTMTNGGQTFSNAGELRVNGDLSYGVYTIGSDAEVYNLGGILMPGSSSIGITSEGDYAYVENYGAISMTGLGGVGVKSTGAIADVYNFGLVETVGTSGYGIWSTGFDAVVENGGEIVTGGSGAHAIFAENDWSSLYNSGVIETAGDGAFGVLATGEDALVENYGEILTSGNAAFGVVADNDRSEVYNGGYVGTTGLSAGGVVTGGVDTLVVNEGVIESTGASGWGVASAGAGTTLVNDGGIFANLDAMAIGLAGDDSTLVLNAGSVIQGAVFLTGGAPLLVIGDGLNTALTVNANDVVSLDTSGKPFAASGALLAVVDPTAFDAEIAGVDQLSASLADALGHRVLETRGNRAWALGVGGFGSQIGALSDVRFSNVMAGVLAGLDWNVSENVELGVFAGGAVNSATAPMAQQINAANALMGTRLRWRDNGFFVDGSVFFGGGAYASERIVANNMVFGGLEYARADYSGLFWGAAVTGGKSVEMARFIVTPSARLRYLGLANGAFAETGTAADLSVNPRTASVIELRGQVALSSQALVVDGGRYAWGGYLGVENKWTGHDDINAELLAQPVTLAAAASASAMRGFVGFDARYTAEEGYTLGASAELGFGAGGAVSSSFNMLFKKPF